MKSHEWMITYYAKGEAAEMVGSGRGRTVDEAMEDFFFWHSGEVEDVIDVEFYK